MYFQLGLGAFCAVVVQLLLVKSAFGTPSNVLLKDLDGQIDARSLVDCRWNCSDDGDRTTSALNIFQSSTCTSCVSTTSYNDNSFAIKCSACEGGCAAPAATQCNTIPADTLQERDTAERKLFDMEDFVDAKAKRATTTLTVPSVGNFAVSRNNGVILNIQSERLYAMFIVSNGDGNQQARAWSFIDLDSHGGHIIQGGIMGPGVRTKTYYEKLAIPGDKISFLVD